MPGLVYVAMTLTLVVVVGVLAVTQQRTAPPTIAEFAPQAVQQLTGSEALGEGGFGSGAEARSASEPDVRGRAAPEDAIDVARVRQCIGEPPRQTEDPQSPPCVPYWSGENGGATAKGVTRDEIRIVNSNFRSAADDEILSSFFNRRFEFYGRKMRVITLPMHGAGCERQKADAASIDEQHRAFASIGTSTTDSACFNQELARRQIVSAAAQGLLSEKEMAPLHPYLWQYEMAHERLFGSLGQMICSRLAGRDAAHSRDPTLSTNARKFGVVIQEESREGIVDAAPLDAALAACGERAAVTVRSRNVWTAAADEGGFAENAMLQMRSQGVSSVICLCVIFRTQYLNAAATNQGYFPEWLVTSYLYHNSNIQFSVWWTTEQRARLMGILAEPPMRESTSEPAAMAVRETSPGTDPAAMNPNGNWDEYRIFLLLASGIQMAGPHLTPETFAAGLQRTRFPNPPSRSGAVGFQNDHSMTDDVAEWWWSESAVAPENEGTSERNGAMCYVNAGARVRFGSWPQEPDPFFVPPCVPDPGL